MDDAYMHLMSFGSKGKSDGLFENRASRPLPPRACPML